MHNGCTNTQISIVIVYRCGVIAYGCINIDTGIDMRLSVNHQQQSTNRHQLVSRRGSGQAMGTHGCA